MASLKDRVHPRYQVDLPATMYWRKNSADVRVHDVSLGGAYLATEEHPPLRELVRIEFKLPGRKAPFTVHGMAVNFALVGDVDGRPVGLGVQLYAMDREMQRTWSEFVDTLRKAEAAKPPPPRMAPRPVVTPQDVAPVVPPPVAATRPAAPQKAPAAVAAIAAPVAAPARAPAPAPVVASAPVRVPPSPVPSLRTPPAASLRPDLPRVASFRPAQNGNAMEFEIEVQSLDELYLFYERDASVGGMFIPTDVNLSIRARVLVCLKHPTSGEFFEIPATVVHIEYDLDMPGVGVEFLEFNEEARAALASFVYEDVENDDGHAHHELPPAPEDEEDDALARLFEPWAGDPEMRPWSKPPDEEINRLFGALEGEDLSGLRFSQPPMPGFEDAPDFRLSIPSWNTRVDIPGSDDIVDLSADVSLEMDDTPSQTPRHVGGR